MPKGFGNRLKSVLPLFLLAVFFLQSTLDAGASTGATLGFRDSVGAFIPMCRVKKEGSAIILTKVNPRDSFQSVDVRFVFPRSSRSSDVKGLFIQWEKRPGRMGRQWALEGHRGYSRSKRVFHATWKISPSFKIIDRAASGSFSKSPWDKIISVSIDGRKMVPKPTKAPKQPLPDRRQSRVEETPLGREKPTRASVRPQERAQATLPWSRVMALQREIETKHRDLLGRIVKLENSVNAAQNSVASIQRWFYWGPLIALTLSILFTCITLFLTFTRLSRSRDPGRMPYTPYSTAKYRPESKFRKRG
jgi:hypothetical protein